MKMAMIVAMDEDGFIGKGNRLPWRLASDMARFKRLTVGGGVNSVIMGRKTWNSLPASFRPLPERANIVMSRDSGWQAGGAMVAPHVERAIEISFSEGSEECWVVGGAQVYEMFLEKVSEIHVTTVHTIQSGDIRFPKWDRGGWSEMVVDNCESDDENECGSTYSVWTRS